MTDPLAPMSLRMPIWLSKVLSLLIITLVTIGLVMLWICILNHTDTSNDARLFGAFVGSALIGMLGGCWSVLAMLE
ncbi:MAG: hypothetical protein ABIG68_14820 [Acidobacteriota bacterium]